MRSRDSLTPAQERAALAVARDEQSDREIAAACGIDRRTLSRWKLRADFAARVAEHRETWREQLRAEGLAQKQNRLDALSDRWQRLRRLIEARAADPTMAAVPGGDTGLLVRAPHLVKLYEVAGEEDGDELLAPAKERLLVHTHTLDTGLLRELREMEKQAAQELGQWVVKQDTSGDVQVRRYIGVEIDEV